MYTAFWNYIKQSNNIAIVSHLVPDGDTLGSSFALYYLLKRMQKKVTLVNFDTQATTKFAFLKDFDKIKRELPLKCDLIITCDCGDLKSAGLDEKKTTLINIDHHVSNTYFGELNIVHPYAACGMVVEEILQSAPIRVSKESYEALFVSICEDTNSFKTLSTNAHVFQVIQKCLEMCIDIVSLLQRLHYNEPLALFRLRSLAMNSLEIHHSGTIASMQIGYEDLQKSGALPWMAKGLASIGLSLANVKFSYIIQEFTPNKLKVSLRSDGCIDASEIAQLFGGGGHKNSAAFYPQSFDNSQFLQTLQGYIL